MANIKSDLTMADRSALGDSVLYLSRYPHPQWLGPSSVPDVVYARTDPSLDGTTSKPNKLTSDYKVSGKSDVITMRLYI